MGNPITISIDRLYSIAIGATFAVLANVLIFPIWAGEQLHKELVKRFNSVADSLEGKLMSFSDFKIQSIIYRNSNIIIEVILECVRKYQGDDGSNSSRQ